MSKKRIVGLSILVAMLLGQLAACGDTPTGSEDTSPSESTDTTAPIVVSEYEAPDVDYKGETFTIASFDFDLAYAIAGYTIINHEEETSDPINDAIVKMTRAVEDDLNIKLELFPLTNDDRFSNSKITQSIYAGDDEIQAAFGLSCNMAAIFGEPTLLTDLNTIPTLDLSHSWWNQNAVKEYNIGGMQFATLGDICLFSKGAPLVYFFNKQLLEDNKLEDPYELVRNGTWTIDKMIEMATTAAKPVDANGTVHEKEDIYGILCEASTPGYMFVGSDINFISRDEDENIDLIFPVEKAATVLEKLIPFIRNQSVSLYAGDWYGKYNVFPELMTPTFMENRGLFFSNQLMMALDFRAMDADFGILPMPKYDEAQKEYYGYSNSAWHDVLYVPSTNKDLERTGNVLDAMGYYSQQYITPAFIDTTVFDKSMRDDDSAEMVRLVLDSQVYDIARMFDWGGLNGMIDTLVTNKKTDIASAYASNMPKIEAAIEKTMGALLGK